MNRRRSRRTAVPGGLLTADHERRNARVGADRRVLMRQSGAYAPKGRFQCAGHRVRIWLASLRFRRGRGGHGADPGLSAVDGSAPLFGGPRSASGRVGICTPKPPSPTGSLSYHQSLAGRQRPVPGKGVSRTWWPTPESARRGDARRDTPPHPPSKRRARKPLMISRYPYENSVPRGWRPVAHFREDRMKTDIGI